VSKAVEAASKQGSGSGPDSHHPDRPAREFWSLTSGQGTINGKFTAAKQSRYRVIGNGSSFGGNSLDTTIGLGHAR
jgi:hypothetical protein